MKRQKERAREREIGWAKNFERFFVTTSVHIKRSLNLPKKADCLDCPSGPNRQHDIRPCKMIKNALTHSFFLSFSPLFLPFYLILQGKRAPHHTRTRAHTHTPHMRAHSHTRMHTHIQTGTRSTSLSHCHWKKSSNVMDMQCICSSKVKKAKTHRELINAKFSSSRYILAF